MFTSDPSEFEGPRFDLYICKMLISIYSWFFHTIFKDLTEQILYPKCNRMHHFAYFWKTMFWGEGGGVGGGGVANPRSPTAFSLSRVGMYAKIRGQHRVTLQNYKATWISLLTNEKSKSTFTRQLLRPLTWALLLVLF